MRLEEFIELERLLVEAIEKLKAGKFGEVHKILDELKKRIPEFSVTDANFVTEYFNSVEELIKFLKGTFRNEMPEDELIVVGDYSYWTNDFKSVEELINAIRKNC